MSKGHSNTVTLQTNKIRFIGHFVCSRWNLSQKIGLNYRISLAPQCCAPFSYIDSVIV
jgi:hypothetical protein